MGCCTKLCTSTVRQHVAAAGVGHGAMAGGILLAWSTLAITQLHENEAFAQISRSSEAWISNVTFLGALFTILPTGFLVDKFGRRITMLLSAVPIIVGWVFIIMAQSVGIMVLGRFIAGISVGAFSVVLPIYMSEIAETRIRGMIVYSFMQQLFAGALFVLIIGHIMEWSWKILVVKSIPISIVYFIAAYFLPESPLHLFSIGQKQRGIEALKWFRVTTRPESLEAEIKEASNDEAINLDNLQPSSSCSSHGLGRQLGIPAILMLLQQCTLGTPLILGTVSITEAIRAGQENLSLNSIVLTITLTALVTIAIASHLVDKVGRRPLLVTSFLVMSLSLVILGFSIDPAGGPEVKWIRLISLSTYILAYSLGVGPISWLLMAEMVPGRRKGLWTSLVTICNWLPAFLIGMYFPVLTNLMTLPGCLWVISGVSVLGALFSYFFVPETAKRTFFEIQSIFENTLKMESPI